jgi:general stress protein CsbA
MRNAREDKKAFSKKRKQISCLHFPFMLVELCAMATFQRFFISPNIYHYLVSTNISCSYGYDCLQIIDFHRKMRKAQGKMQASAFFFIHRTENLMMACVKIKYQILPFYCRLQKR